MASGVNFHVSSLPSSSLVTQAADPTGEDSLNQTTTSSQFLDLRSKRASQSRLMTWRFMDTVRNRRTDQHLARCPPLVRQSGLFTAVLCWFLPVGQWDVHRPRFVRPDRRLRRHAAQRLVPVATLGVWTRHLPGRVLSLEWTGWPVWINRNRTAPMVAWHCNRLHSDRLSGEWCDRFWRNRRPVVASVLIPFRGQQRTHQNGNCVRGIGTDATKRPGRRLANAEIGIIQQRNQVGNRGLCIGSHPSQNFHRP